MICVCVCVFVHVCTYIHTYIHTHTHTYILYNTHAHTPIHTQVYIQYIHTHTDSHTHIHTIVYIHTALGYTFHFFSCVPVRTSKLDNGGDDKSIDSVLKVRYRCRISRRQEQTMLDIDVKYQNLFVGWLHKNRMLDILIQNIKICLFVGCLSSQQHASVSQGRICSHNFTCCHTETEAAAPTVHLTQSQHTDARPTAPSTDPVTPGAWQGSH